MSNAKIQMTNNTQLSVIDMVIIFGHLNFELS
jgi:hypothetical protein